MQVFSVLSTPSRDQRSSAVGTTSTRADRGFDQDCTHFPTLVIDDVEPYGACSVASLSSFTTTISVMDSLSIDIDHPAVKEYLSLVRFVGLVFTGVIWDTTDNRRRKGYRS